RKLHALVLGYRMPVGDSLQGPNARKLDQPLGGPAGARGDEEALGGKPGLRTVLTARGDAVTVRHPAVDEPHLRVPGDVGVVHEMREADELNARVVAANQEKRLLL